MFRCRLIVDDLAVFFNNDIRYAYNFGFYNCLFVRIDTVYYVVGDNNMGYPRRVGGSVVLACL